MERRLTDIVDMGSRALGDLQEDTGLWRDFDIGIGRSSDEWVTAFICEALGAVGGPSYSLVARAGKALSAAQHADGGWGYNATTPSDADTTSMAVLGMIAAGASFNQSAAVQFLLSHRDSNEGGFRTYKNDLDLRVMYQRLSKRVIPSFAGWCSGHTEVTAVVAEALATMGFFDTISSQQIASYLRSQVRSDGLWNGYWSVDWFYPTYRVVRSLKRIVPASDREAQRVRQTIEHRSMGHGVEIPDPDARGCPYRTALMLELLLDERTTYAGMLNSGANWLMDQQQSQGVWVSGRDFLRVPPPHVMDPDNYTGWGENGSGLGARFRDPAGIATTAVVLRFLHKYRRVLEKKTSRPAV